jgi:hypothetical protein
MTTTSFKIVRLLALAIVVAGLAVVIGWLANVTALTSLRPNWPSLKFSGAVGFILGGATLYLMALARRDSDAARTFLPLSTLGIVLLAVPALASEILGFNLNIESLFLAGATGRPSIGGIIGYLVVAVAGLVVFDNPRRSGRYLVGAGVILCIIGGLALLGYAINDPLLYYQFGQGGDNGVAMAAHAAALFVLLGVGFLLTSRDHEVPSPASL